MTNLLRRIFIRNYHDIKDKTIRNKHGKLAAFVGIFTNALLFCAKMLIGILSMSISIISDSINNLSDMSSSIITLIGFKISAKPADDEHPYGHERVEYIIGLIISIIIIAVGVQLFVSAIQKIISNSAVKYDLVVIIILSVSILLKLWQSLFYRKIGKIIDSIALKATSFDSLSDVISTSVILIGACLGYFFDLNIDGYLGVGVSLFIIVSAIKMILEVVNPLIGVKPDTNFTNMILEEISTYDKILGTHDLVCHMYGPTQYFITLHVEIDANTDLWECHKLIDEIESDINQKYNIELVIHVDPIKIDCPTTTRLKNAISDILALVSDNIFFHDFRILEEEEHTIVFFDLDLPEDCAKTAAEIEEILKEKMKDENLVFHIHFDHFYEMNQ